MSVYCPTIPRNSWIGGLLPEPAAGPEAECVRVNVKKSLTHYREPRLSELYSSIANVYVHNQISPFPVTMDTARKAAAFADLLPRAVPLPEVSADPDGEIAFDWSTTNGNMFSVSINGSGRISYAGSFGEHSRIHGTEELADEIPEEVLRGINKASR